MIKQSLSNTNETYYSVQIAKIYNLNMALIWKTWAPLKVKIFLWLAFRRRHWTGDRRRRHGLETREHCYLCDQAPETIEHIVVTCPYTRGVWSLIYQAFGRQLRQGSATIIDWWRRLRSWLDQHPALRHGLVVRAGFLGGLEAKERAMLRGCYAATD